MAIKNVKGTCCSDLDKEISNLLIAISVKAGKIAQKIRKESKNGSDKGTVRA